MRRALATLTAITIAASISLFAIPAPTRAAYAFMGYAFQDENISVCFQGFSEQRKSTSLSAFNWWEQVANVNIYEDCGFGGIFYDVQISAQNINDVATGGCIALSGNTVVYNGQTKQNCVDGIIVVDSETWNDWNWLNSSDSMKECFMVDDVFPEACPRDGKTIMAHEMGHVLGLGHVGGGDCSSGRLVGTIWVPWTGWDYKPACSATAEHLMANYAGNEGDWLFSFNMLGGFRHWDLRDGDIDGIRQLYGP